jgi:hypothetical protein
MHFKRQMAHCRAFCWEKNARVVVGSDSLMSSDSAL